MDISEYARQVLFSADLSEKLVLPESFTDENIDDKVIVVDAPGRPPALQFSQGSKTPFPKVSSMAIDSHRGLALHFFANHELLAMELMALALLRFPEAPKEFRKGIAMTMLEERRHMKLYVDRMESLGVGLGDASSNHFFWTSMVKMTSPLQYLAGLSLCFEQANLDYAVQYKKVFDGVGDQESAAIMKVVYEEEIGHVKFGATWFEKMRASKQDFWSEFCEQLIAPLNPRRAKGHLFDQEGREKAGLSPEFIDCMRYFSGSRGRPGALRIFNGDCEDVVGFGAPKKNDQSKLTEIMLDLDQLQFLISNEEDVLISGRPMDAPFYEEWKKLGIKIPEITTLTGLKNSTKERQFSAWEPWGWDPNMPGLFQQFDSQLIDQAKTCDWRQLDESFEPSTMQKKCFSKAWAIDLRLKSAELPLGGLVDGSQLLQVRVCQTISEIRQALKAFDAEKFEWAVVKGLYGSSGRHAKRLKCGNAPDEAFGNWCQKQIQQHGAVVVEPWLDKVAEFSIQLDLKPARQDHYLGLTRMISSQQGQYQGHVLKNKFGELSDLDSESSRRGLAQKDEYLAAFRCIAEFVSSQLRSNGYQGLAGVDCFLYRHHLHSNKHYLMPILEVNSRMTMGYLALKLESKISSGSRATWQHYNQKQIEQFGFSSFQKFADNLKAKHPLKLKNKMIDSGVVFTNSPDQASHRLGVLLVEV